MSEEAKTINTLVRGSIRPLLIAGVMLFVILEIVALSPSSLEKPSQISAGIPMNALTESKVVLAPGIPHDRVADYSIDRFFYVSTQNGMKQWKLIADKAYLYNDIKLVHSVNVTAYLYDSQDKITVVTGKEAKYVMNQKDLEVFGNVVTRFPDGFQTKSEYLRYLPGEHRVEVPDKYAITGSGTEPDGQTISFTGQGMRFAMDKSQVIIDRSVRFVMTRAAAKNAENQGVADSTVIESDHCVIERNDQLATFTMNPNRPLDTRFVRITQPNLFVRSRWAQLNYGSYANVMQYLIAKEDVLVRETGKPSLRYGTAGRAEFDTRREVVVMKEYPQVYQDNDTVTGDIILLHRDTDIVEVEHSNAFSEGEEHH